MFRLQGSVLGLLTICLFMGETVQTVHFKSNQIMVATEFPLSDTPVQLEAMETFLQNYPDQLAASELYEGFKFGFPIHYEGPIKSFEWSWSGC